MFSDTPEGFRSGFVSFVGRPNTGKSTLTNALVGQKIAITADQPETTRHPIRGIVHREDAQTGVVLLQGFEGVHGRVRRQVCLQLFNGFAHGGLL